MDLKRTQFSMIKPHLTKVFSYKWYVLDNKWCVILLFYLFYK